MREWESESEWAILRGWLVSEVVVLVVVEAVKVKDLCCFCK